MSDSLKQRSGHFPEQYFGWFRRICFAATDFQGNPTVSREERFVFTVQIRYSSRPIGANLAEAWAKRRFSAHLSSKLTNVDGEAGEPWHWLETACACGYLDNELTARLLVELDGICQILGRIMQEADTFVPPRSGKAGGREICRSVAR